MKSTTLFIALPVLFDCIAGQTVLAVEFKANGVVKFSRPENSKAKAPSPREVPFAFRDDQRHFAERVQASNGGQAKARLGNRPG
jgi:hypothetical protein